MTLSRKKIAAILLGTTALAGAALAVPSYAQQAPAAPDARVMVVHRGPGGPGGPGAHGPQGHGAQMNPAEFLETYDTDGNGVVTQAEIDAVRAAELAEFDANGDGVLNLEEYQALWLSKMFERMVDSFQHFDANGDGTVTLAEFNEGVANIVERMDRDGDGAIGPADRPERPEAPRGNAAPGAGPGPR